MAPGSIGPVHWSVEKRIQAQPRPLIFACQVNNIDSVGKRVRQREQTRDRIVAAAAEAFSELGFRAASTREIAARAGTNQGLITYHFRSKDQLWRAAVDRIFGMLRASLRERRASLAGRDARERGREGIRAFVRFAAAHPELFRLMVEEGKSEDERMQWLVDTHLKPLYDGFQQFAPGMGGPSKPHGFYALAGAASLLFAVAPECRRLTGLDPTREQAIETHAEFVARLMVP
jgi:TetR/AcrR family transcriptional regulator